MMIDKKWSNAIAMYSYIKKNKDAIVVKRNGLFYIKIKILQETPIGPKYERFYIDPREFF